MNSNDIELAFFQYLDAMPNCPEVVFPNGPSPTQKEYLEAAHVPSRREDETLDGTGLFQAGAFQLLFVTTGGVHSARGNEIFEQIASRFHKGLRLPVADPIFVVSHPPNSSEGFKDKSNNWCVPIRIRYLTED